MPNPLYGDVANDRNASDMDYSGKLQKNGSVGGSYQGKAKDGGSDIGLAKSNNSKDIGLTKQASGKNIGTSGKKSGYSPNNSIDSDD